MDVRRGSMVGALLLAACGSATSTELRTGGEPEVRWTGRITYESRHSTPQGASRALETRPARFVDLALLDAAGEVLSEGRTNGEGRFSLEGPPTAATLRTFARVRVRGHDAAVSRDALGRETHHLDASLSDPAQELALHAPDAEDLAGAFHIVDTLLVGLDAVHEWTGRALPPVFTYWVRGGTREWSYYRGERPEGSGRYAIELLGGDPGQQSITDTDEHDEAIILHELGHFVMDRLTSDSSTGGTHPRNVRIDPGLAWEEGRASWFALAVLRAPIYRDTIGVEPWGSLRVDEDLERGPDRHPGLGSETSVSKILWDLSDGAGGLPDEDEDGVALGPAAVLGLMIELAGREGSFPALPTFLRHVVTRGLVPEETLRAMLVRTNEPADLLPRTDEDAPWPRRLTIGAAASGKIDGLTQPAPGGGPNLPATGFDAIHTYLVRVPEAGMLVVHLEIVGSGRIADRQDLDLELLDLRADRISDSRSESARESVAHLVQPGWYIVRVRDGGAGNRADYRVRALIDTLSGLPARP